MCRVAAYLGPAAPLSTLVFDPPHSLEEQAYRPREMVTGTVNVDGTGVAWWPEGATEPVRYVSATPPWADENLRSMGTGLVSGAQLATVRSATPGLPTGSGAALPFVHGRHAGTHNGYVAGFKERAARPLIERLPEHLFTRLDVVSDSLVLFLLVIDRLERSAGCDLGAALASATCGIREQCETLGVEASLNLVLTDGRTVAATRSALGMPPNSLYVLDRGRRWPGAALLASEPLDDDDGWASVPEEALVVWDGGGWRLEQLDRARTGA
ncbi:MAG: ergothioneine biosynthesis protein EgtC [Acidobacteriota bacterium]|nr:ergothioneine biosynthesis protein EgtC [Acidobacteriota bacterium]